MNALELARKLKQERDEARLVVEEERRRKAEELEVSKRRMVDGITNTLNPFVEAGFRVSKENFPRFDLWTIWKDGKECLTIVLGYKVFAKPYSVNKPEEGCKGRDGAWEITVKAAPPDMQVTVVSGLIGIIDPVADIMAQYV